MNSFNSSNSSTTSALEARVREAQLGLRAVILGLIVNPHNVTAKHGVDAEDALVSAVRTAERARCREAIKALPLDEWGPDPRFAIIDALAAIDALGEP